MLYGRAGLSPRDSRPGRGAPQFAIGRLSAYFSLQFDNWLAALEGRGPHIAALLEIASCVAAIARRLKSQYIAMFKRLRQYLRDGIADGSFRRLRPTATTRALLGSIDWAFMAAQDTR